MKKPKFTGKPLIIDLDMLEPENTGLHINKVSNEVSTKPLESLFDDIRMRLKLNFDKIANKILSKPNTVFKINSDVDTISIREQVSNLNQTCFYENGRIFAYSNFINEVVFGFEYWLEEESETTQALTLLMVNNQITFDDLRQFVEGDVYEIYNNLISLLFNNNSIMLYPSVFSMQYRL